MKTLMSIVLNGDKRPVSQIVDEQNLLLKVISDEEYDALARAIISDHQQIVQQIRLTRKASKLGFLIGQMFCRGEAGCVEASRAEATLRRLLGL